MKFIHYCIHLYSKNQLFEISKKHGDEGEHECHCRKKNSLIANELLAYMIEKVKGDTGQYITILRTIYTIKTWSWTTVFWQKTWMREQKRFFANVKIRIVRQELWKWMISMYIVLASIFLKYYAECLLTYVTFLNLTKMSPFANLRLREAIFINKMNPEITQIWVGRNKRIPVI